MSTDLSRRGFFSALTRRRRSAPAGPARAPEPSAPPQPVEAAAASVPPAGVEAAPQVAVIQGRFCLAYTSICSVCAERCPVPGAIRTERGIPSVVADTCTGCGVCHDVCPAPRNAVLVLPRNGRPAPGRLAPPPARRPTVPAEARRGEQKPR